MSAGSAGARGAALLTPAQLDIYLDESAGSPQRYGIGAHWKVKRPASAARWQAAVAELERAVAPLVAPLAEAFAVAPAQAIRFTHELAEAASVEERARQLVQAPWDFAQGFLRVAVIDAAEGDQRLVVASHHLVLDGSSVLALSQALAERCAGKGDEGRDEGRGQASRDRSDGGGERIEGFGAPAQRYAEIAAEYAADFDHPETLAFWKRHAEPLGAAIELPPVSPASAELVERHAGDDAQLREFCRAHKISPPFYWKCLFAWVVMQHYSLASGVAVGEIVNQRRARWPQVWGNFVGISLFVLALPRGPGEAKTFGEVLSAGRALQQARRNLSHLSQVAAKRHGLRPEGMRLLFNFHDYSRRIGGGELELVTPYTSEDPRALQLYVYHDGAGQLRVRGAHPEGAAAMARFLDALLHVHRQLMSGEEELARLEVVSPADRARLDEWNATETPFEDEALLHELFERQVARSPGAVALVSGTRTMSYGELNARANQLARWLRAQGVAPDERVGLHLERSFEMLIAILGVLKAGAAYLPLEPEFPAARLGYMIENAGARLILTQAHLPPIAGASAVRTLALDGAEGRAALDAQAAEDLPRLTTSRHLAYVMYTSGSTGQPKGVMIEHRSVVNRLLWSAPAFGLSAADVCLQKTPFGFDISVWELLWPLQAGARLVIAPPGAHRDPWALSQLFAEHGVTVVHFVASMLRLFLDCADLTLARGVRHVVNGGEALPLDTYRDAVARLPHARIWNLYGPTEATIEATYWEGERGQRYEAVPIGKPLSNVRCYIVNPWRKRVPVGMVGELCLGGVQLARGYLGQPELTAERFPADPFAATSGERLYFTGDLARYQADGTIDYLGRIDHQVKIRGYRIELGEIEARLREHPQVSEAVVVARGEGDGKQLVAYVVGREGLGAAALRGHAAETLPDYMVPPVIVELKQMPLSANGKLDRKALPAPPLRADEAEAAVEAALGPAGEPPRGEVELALAELWRELLDGASAARFARSDSFFARGGHSLSAMRLALRVQERFGVRFPLAEVFAHPSLSAMAEAVRASAQRSPVLAVLPVLRGARDGELPLSPGQRRLWFLAQLDGEDPAYHLAAVVEIEGKLDRAALRAALDQLVARHESLRTTFAAVDGEPRQRIAAADCGFALVEQKIAKRDVAEAVREEARRPFDLERGPLIRGRLLRVSDQRHALVITQHHIISDGWSLGILARELGALYRGAVLAPLPIQYADWAAWQARRDVTAQAAYWRAQLAGAPPSLELPVDRPRRELRARSGAVIELVLEEELTAALRQLAQRHEATLFMTVLAGWAAVLARLSGQREVVIGTFAAHRNAPESLGVIGFFVNTLALRVAVGEGEQGAASVAGLLARVKETVLGAQAHQEVPFEQVVELVQPPRRLTHTPIFQVALAWQSDERDGLALEGLQVRTREAEVDTARFELELSLGERKGKLVGGLRYDAGLFDRETAARHGELLRETLRAMTSGARAWAEGAAGTAAVATEALAESVATSAATAATADAAATAPAGPRPLAPRPHQPPEGELEESIAAIWSELLGGVRVGRHDSFFELGGHSLLATRVVARLRRHAAELPVRALFEAPTVAELAARVSAIRTDAPAPAGSIPRAEGAARRQLSFAQERLWFLQQLEPHSTAYNMFSALRVQGPLDVLALQRALARLVERHEILRTRFVGEARGEQEVLAARPVAFSVVSAGEAELPRLLEEEAARPFDLIADPLLRAAVIELGPGQRVLMLSLHHLVADGWSIDVLLDEIGRLYGDETLALPPLPIQYADYAAWQRAALQGEELARLEGYWRRQLAGPLPSLSLPWERPTPSRQGAELAISVEREVLAGLQAQAQRQGASLFMVLLAACGALLHRLTSQVDVVLGAPVAGRTRAETEGLIGCFINALALRLDLSGDPTFGELVERAKAVSLGAYEHQALPFEKLVELVQPERQLHQHPIFDVMLNVVNVPARRPALAGVELAPMAPGALGAPQAKVGLTIYAVEEEGELRLRLVWQRERYAAGQMEALAHQLAGLLRQVAADAAQPISGYSLVTARHGAVLPDPRAPLGEAPVSTVVALFREAAEQHAERVAIRAGGERYCYAALARRAEAVARMLLDEERLAPGDVVAISGRRSFGLIAAMLGVWQAGGVILTLDKDTPTMRRREILEEAGARRLLWVGERGAEICRDQAWQTLRLLEEAGGEEAAPPEGWLPPIDPNAPAYLFFTSGTTGRPKGILGQHKGLAHFLAWQRERFAIGPQDRAAQLTGLGFDVVLRDVLTPLISGATLCLLDDEDDLSAPAIVPWLAREEVTMLHTVPTLAKAWLVEERYLRPLPALRQVFFAGEPLPASLVRGVRRHLSASARLVNLYGPTETTMAKAAYVVPEAGDEDDALPPSLPVGRAMTATQLLVLDGARRPCGVGEPGEVVIRTRFPSLGYLHGGHSAPQFTVSPVRDDASDLWYATGDLGRFDADGVLWLMGRKDDQVKIRGMRVELGEIHAAVLAHPEIKEAAITVFGQEHLAAYYVSGEAAPEPAALRSFVRARLPEHLVPLAWIKLERLPATANGKLDRTRLPDPSSALVSCGEGYVAPATEHEAMVVAVWQEVLGRGEVGTQANFFDLGGTSLLLLRVKTRLQEALQREVPVVALFQHPTAAGLAAYLGGRDAASAVLSAVADRARLRKSLGQNRRRR